MLAFAVEYKDVINNMCDNRKLTALHSCSLDEEEWIAVAALSNVLKVRSSTYCHCLLSHMY
jgi:hypothetical protein